MFIIGEVMHVLGHGASGKFLYLPSNFAVTLKLLWKKKKSLLKNVVTHFTKKGLFYKLSCNSHRIKSIWKWSYIAFFLKGKNLKSGNSFILLDKFICYLTYLIRKATHNGIGRTFGLQSPIWVTISHPSSCHFLTPTFPYTKFIRASTPLNLLFLFQSIRPWL